MGAKSVTWREATARRTLGAQNGLELFDFTENEGGSLPGELDIQTKKQINSQEFE